VKKKILILLLAVVLCLSCQTSKSEKEPRWPDNRDEFIVDFSEPEITIYEIASLVTGAPADIIKGFHFAESSYGKNLNHTNKVDRGPFGLHESAAYHAERAAKWGEYNPDCPLQAAIIAGYIYMENLAVLQSESLAVCAYRQGVSGVRAKGAELWYYNRVVSV